MTPRIGSTFSGYGGLDLAVTDVLGGDVVWHCEQDPAASAVLAHHWPAVPNLGDITAVDWSAVEPVDILTGGFPCQDISFAGQGAGIEGARSGLWRYLADAIRVLRPRLVVLENVAAVLVRGLDRVQSDLAGLGYDVRWTCLRASDVGAPHRRRRWFAVAYPADSAGARRGWDEPECVGADGGAADGSGQAESGRRDRGAPADTEGDGRHEGRPEPARQLGGCDPAVGGDVAAADPGCDTRPEDNQDRPVAARSSGTPADADRATHGTEPHSEPQQPQADHEQRRLDVAGRVLDWGQYEPAIRRWEHALGHPAPEPTVVGRRGGQQLNPAFVEWMMGVPGHITSVPGLSRNDMLRLAGNGVVPQQGAAALRWLLTAGEVRAA